MVETVMGMLFANVPAIYVDAICRSAFMRALSTGIKLRLKVNGVDVFKPEDLKNTGKGREDDGVCSPHRRRGTSVPTLVMHARDDAVVAFDLGGRLAAGIPGARFVPPPSSQPGHHHPSISVGSIR